MKHSTVERTVSKCSFTVTMLTKHQGTISECCVREYKTCLIATFPLISATTLRGKPSSWVFLEMLSLSKKGQHFCPPPGKDVPPRLRCKWWSVSEHDRTNRTVLPVRRLQTGDGLPGVALRAAHVFAQLLQRLARLFVRLPVELILCQKLPLPRKPSPPKKKYHKLNFLTKIFREKDNF